MRIQILLDGGVPEELAGTNPAECDRKPIEDEIRESLDLINSGHDSSIEFRAIRGLYDQLTKMKQTERVRNLRKMIKPTLSKFGYHVE